jgi:transcriptional regulator with XRE-family HTH domain
VVLYTKIKEPMMRYVPSFKDPRLHAGLTQQEVAVRLGRTQPAIQKWESGINSPTMEDLCRLAELYDAEPGTFFRAEDGPDFVASIGDLRIVIECKHYGSDAPKARERLRRQLKECGAALSTVPQDFADHWIAGLKACALIVAHEMKHSLAERTREQSSKSIDPAIRGANDGIPRPESRRRSKRPKSVPGGQIS